MKILLSTHQVHVEGMLLKREDLWLAIKIKESSKNEWSLKLHVDEIA